jgi:CheY-like chemotaxis protein
MKPPLEPAGISRPPNRERLVLIVERDDRVRDLQRFFLEKSGFRVEFVDDGRTAFERAVETLPDLVVTEILIAPVDGLTLCRQLRDNARTGGIPVLVFSILSAASRATEAGARVFLRKPIVEATFIGAVESLMAAQPTLKADRK